MLLVDSEGPVADPRSPRTHLKERDGWDLPAISERSIHLMIQTMEAWIIADADAVARYYGQYFLKKALPAAQHLERLDKVRIQNALKRATAKTQKKEYCKIRDAAALLRAIDLGILRRRCPSCERLFATVREAID